ncbi:MAG: hypothetical protein M3T49_03195 [Candidatus Eremiobacteraeota bacterium]|nr:hypothetical protein [Candidatus Eremiobacteraeota bacterium]
MNDNAIISVVLIVGGTAYLAVFLSVAAERVREIGPPKAPPHDGHR